MEEPVFRSYLQLLDWLQLNRARRCHLDPTDRWALGDTTVICLCQPVADAASLSIILAFRLGFQTGDW